MHYQTHMDDHSLMPTTSQLLGGWIVVQIRGAPVPESHQLCRHPNGRIVLIDYGHWKPEQKKAA
jgi:hypothetical protein